MSQFFKAELKDKFLRYAAERDDYFETQLLYDEFLRPSYNLEYVEKLIKEIIDHNPDLLDIMSGNGVKIFMLSSTAYTEDFVEEGGFTDSYIKEEEKWDTLMEQLASTRKLSTQEKVNLGKTEKQVYKRERTLLYFLISAVIFSFLISLASLLNTLFFRPEYVKKTELDALLSEERQEFKLQNDKLRNQLNEVLLRLEERERDSIIIAK